MKKVEGIDGTGKSDTCKLLAERIGAVLYATPSGEYAKRKDEVNRNATNEEHYAFFLEAIRFASSELYQLRQNGQNVVVDRYWLTTAVYHLAMGVDVDLSDFEDLLVPDVTIYLTVSPEVQKQRLAVRGVTAGDIRMSQRQNLLRQLYEELLTRENNVIKIDTSEINQATVVEKIIQALALPF